MTDDHLADKHLLPVLIAGFTLVCLLLVASGVVSFESMRLIESDAANLVAQQQNTVRLSDEMQSEEGNLSNVFYSLATQRGGANRKELLERLDALETAIHRTTDAGIASRDSVLWNKVRKAADGFIQEGRDILNSNRPPSQQFFERHQDLLAALANLTSSNFFARNEAQAAERERASERMRHSLALLAIALAISAASAGFTIYSVNRTVRSLRWQAAELKLLSSRVMSDQEETSRRLANEMHDHLGQMLSAIEANLVSMQHARTFHPGRLEDCLGLLKDAVENVREVSQLLRPSILDDFGLSASLLWLAERYSERNGIPVRFHSTFSGRLVEEQETQLFRIAQEALTNISRHSKATEVDLQLNMADGMVTLSIADNGVGMTPKVEHRGLGLVGMRARARTAGGILRIVSTPNKGVTISIEIPYGKAANVSQTTNPVGG